MRSIDRESFQAFALRPKLRRALTVLVESGKGSRTVDESRIRWRSKMGAWQTAQQPVRL